MIDVGSNNKEERARIQYSKSANYFGHNFTSRPATLFNILIPICKYSRSSKALKHHNKQ